MRRDRIAKITEFLQVFKLMTILLKGTADEIANFSNYFNWYLESFYFIYCYKLML